jgi:uncharacterized RDD family membrane protein YckC
LYCMSCGAGLPKNAAFCAYCGTPVAGGGEPHGSAGSLPPGIPGVQTAAPDDVPAARTAGVPAGFWRRFWGHLLDHFLLGVVMTPVILLIMMPLMATSSIGWADSDLPEEVAGALAGAVLTVVFMTVTVNWLYFAILHSSSRQATIGQWALGIRITDLDARRISFARASGRYFASMLTGLTFGIGYLIMLLTARRQTLHDLIAGTVVVR